jgi:hypothetical protein
MGAVPGSAFGGQVNSKLSLRMQKNQLEKELTALKKWKNEGGLNKRIAELTKQVANVNKKIANNNK